jgi:predicted transcriptional regulator
MSYAPKPGSMIDHIFKIIPNNRPVQISEIKSLLHKKHPHINTTSVSTHLNFLASKGLVFREQSGPSGFYVYSRSPFETSSKQLDLVETEQAEFSMDVSRAKCTLLFCQRHVGKRIVSRKAVEACGKSKKDTAPLEALRKLKETGYIQYIEDTLPYEYLVLPEIKTLTKIPIVNKKTLPSIAQPRQELQPQIPQLLQNNIANMSITDIISEYMTLKHENQRLKESLQRIAVEFVQLGLAEEQ